jgi:hypothetical protein
MLSCNFLDDLLRRLGSAALPVSCDGLLLVVLAQLAGSLDLDKVIRRDARERLEESSVLPLLVRWDLGHQYDGDHALEPVRSLSSEMANTCCKT